MRTSHYEIMIKVPMGEGNHGTDWATAKSGVMSKSAAEGLFRMFAEKYETRMFRGFNVGKLVKETAAR